MCLIGLIRLFGSFLGLDSPAGSGWKDNTINTPYSDFGVRAQAYSSARPNGSGSFYSAESITYIIMPARATIGSVGKPRLRCLLWDASTKYRRTRFARPSPNIRHASLKMKLFKYMRSSLYTDILVFCIDYLCISIGTLVSLLPHLTGGLIEL